MSASSQSSIHAHLKSQALPRPLKKANGLKLAFNADVVAIAIALGLAALIRLNVIHHIGW
jgi:hypothetical protein